MKSIYVLKDGHGLLKIGVSSNIRSRLPSLKNGCSNGVSSILISAPTEDAENIERLAHRYFSKSKTSGEWFEITSSEAVLYFANNHQLPLTEYIPNPRGAPPKDNPASSRFEVRCTPDEKKRWAEAADKNGLSLSSWLKSLANKNA